MLCSKNTRWDAAARDSCKGIRICLEALVGGKIPCTVAIAYNFVIGGKWDVTNLPWVVPADVTKLGGLGKAVVSGVSGVLARHEVPMPKAAAPAVQVSLGVTVRASDVLSRIGVQLPPLGL